MKTILNFDSFVNESKKYKNVDNSDFIFPSDSKFVTDGNSHYPIDSIERGRNSLARSNQNGKPKWFNGTLDEFKKIVIDKVHTKYPDIEISALKK